MSKQISTGNNSLGELDLLTRGNCPVARERFRSDYEYEIEHEYDFVFKEGDEVLLRRSRATVTCNQAQIFFRRLK